YRYGQCRTAIRTFQLALNVRGYPVTFQGTSCYYAKTRAAVLAVQRANGIPTHGRLNHRTWNAAFVGIAPQ
ncbi:MAG: hypothetical protein JWO46_2995, partial [Nocardioidaceae bacterium]|nr:hypothetical protein [Nocardioidaceae bacterium]